MTGKLLGIQYSIINQQSLSNLEKQYIVASNHASYYDAVLLSYALPNLIYYISHKLSWISFMRGFIVINFNHKDKGTISECKKQILNGNNIAIFPQGNREKKINSISFKPGIGQIAHKTGLQILPVTLNTYVVAHPYVYSYNIFVSCLCMFRFYRTNNIMIKYHRPVRYYPLLTSVYYNEKYKEKMTTEIMHIIFDDMLHIPYDTESYCKEYISKLSQTHILQKMYNNEKLYDFISKSYKDDFCDLYMKYKKYISGYYSIFNATSADWEKQEKDNIIDVYYGNRRLYMGKFMIFIESIIEILRDISLLESKKRDLVMYKRFARGLEEIIKSDSLYSSG